MGNETKHYRINLSLAELASRTRSKILRNELIRLGFGDNHIFSLYDTKGPNGSRKPPADYVAQPTDEPTVRRDYISRNGSPCTREEKCLDVDRYVEWMATQKDTHGRSFFDYVDREEARADHPDREEQECVEYLKSRVNVFTGKSLEEMSSTGFHPTCPGVEIAVSVWNMNELVTVYGNEDIDPAYIMYKTKEKGTMPIAYVDLGVSAL